MAVEIVELDEEKEPPEPEEIVALDDPEGVAPDDPEAVAPDDGEPGKLTSFVASSKMDLVEMLEKVEAEKVGEEVEMVELELDEEDQPSPLVEI